MFTKIQEIFSIPELKRRVLFTLGLLIVYRIGSHITTPGVDAGVLTEFFERQRGTILGLYDLFAGGNLAKASIFEYIEVFYNRKRRHSTLGFKSPTEFEHGR